MDSYISQLSRQFSQDGVIFVICFLLPVAAGMLYAFRRVTEFEIGPKLATEQFEKLWLTIPATLLLYLSIFFLAPLIPRHWLSGSFFTVIFFAGAALFLGLTSRRLYQRAAIKSDEILLDLGRIETKTMAISGLFLIIAVTSQFFNLHISSLTYWMSVSFILLFFALGCFLVANSLANVFITKSGISRFNGHIAWTEITAFQWAGEHTPVVTIVIKDKQKVSWYIPTHHREKLDELLHLNVPQAVNDSHGSLSSSL